MAGPAVAAGATGAAGGGVAGGPSWTGGAGAPPVAGGGAIGAWPVPVVGPAAEGVWFGDGAAGVSGTGGGAGGCATGAEVRGADGCGCGIGCCAAAFAAASAIDRWNSAIWAWLVVGAVGAVVDGVEGADGAADAAGADGADGADDPDVVVSGLGGALGRAGAGAPGAAGTPVKGGELGPDVGGPSGRSVVPPGLWATGCDGPGSDVAGGPVSFSDDPSGPRGLVAGSTLDTGGSGLTASKSPVPSGPLLLLTVTMDGASGSSPRIVSAAPGFSSESSDSASPPGFSAGGVDSPAAASTTVVSFSARMAADPSSIARSFAS
ncbi:hypothetical protein SAMN04489835_0933 [Mycolicibacterium rutilum]|uniref:Uncharacterized protein n=1 Tax=Mycolicibacterium rutilum TaxID=370526 RepID=A0A1H6ISV4_MYCRU|nr:hypothetical protein SAMN04489835_0933 [Mycolicibacterium rutilum]